jgi:MtN3 and saliva related transmembrane protein
MSIATIMGLIAGLLTTGAFIPQIIKTIRTKDTKNISIWMYFTYLSGCMMWFFYGYEIKENAILVTNIFSTSFGLTMLFLKLKYK